VKTPVISKLPVFETADGGIPPSVPGKVIAWLASSDEAEQYSRQFNDVPKFAIEHDLAKI
jgi:hypothetical protein